MFFTGASDPKNSRSPVRFEPGGGAEVPPLEIKLYLYQDLNAGVTFIFKERLPLYNRLEPPVLQKIAVMRTDDLLQDYTGKE
ncbi:MAG: hypothetical protein ACM3WV_08690 [Bacillota bacterium]